MNNVPRYLQLFLALILAIGLVGPASAPTVAQAANLHPLVAQMAAESPQQMVAVIVQKADASDAAEQLAVHLGGTVTQDLHIINAFVAEMTARAAWNLSRSTSVRWVSLDAAVASTGGKPGGSGGTALPPSTYLDTLGVRQVWNMGLRGEGISVAVIDSGISRDADFSGITSPSYDATGARIPIDDNGGRILRQMSFSPTSNTVNDVYGHGTHVAGIIAGGGSDSSGVYSGIAPLANLISLKISDAAGLAYESDAVAALQWVLDNQSTYNIRVVNLSIQSTQMMSYHQSPLSAAAEIVWFNGVVVVAASGNWQGGAYNPINAAPAHDPFLITVGATDEKGTSRPQDDVITQFTAVGTTLDGLAKPEIYAPGKNIVSVLSKSSSWGAQYPDRLAGNGEYFRISGTSMAAPMVTGAVALLLQAEPNLTPDQVKYRLLNTNRWVSGGRYLNVYALLTTPTTASANTGRQASQLLWTGSEPITWTSVNWNSVNWNAVNWNAVNWNAVNWNAVNWNSLYWGQ